MYETIFVIDSNILGHSEMKNLNPRYLHIWIKTRKCLQCVTKQYSDHTVYL